MNINSDTNQEQLLETIMNDDEFISLATQYVEDKEVIKSKVQVKLGQEIKKHNKPIMKKPDIIELNLSDNNEIDNFQVDWNDSYQLRYVTENITMHLQKDNSIKLVTPEFTIFY